jgi:hypothetical protein
MKSLRALIAWARRIERDVVAFRLESERRARPASQAGVIVIATLWLAAAGRLIGRLV